MSLRENAPSSDPQNHLYKFNYVMSRENYLELDELNMRKLEIEGYSADMINENKGQIDLLLEKIVNERITSAC